MSSKSTMVGKPWLVEMVSKGAKIPTTYAKGIVDAFFDQLSSLVTPEGVKKSQIRWCNRKVVCFGHPSRRCYLGMEFYLDHEMMENLRYAFIYEGGYHLQVVNNALYVLLSMMDSALADGHSVSIRGLGRLYLVKRVTKAAKWMRDSRDSESYELRLRMSEHSLNDYKWLAEQIRMSE